MWYGFNVLWFFSAGGPNPEISPEKIKIDENDLDFMAEMGCNFVRVPTDYRYFVHDFDYGNYDETYLKLLDRAVEAIVSRGLHCSLNVHRGPGYCINGNEWEKHNLWQDKIAQDAFTELWAFFAERYKKYSKEQRKRRYSNLQERRMQNLQIVDDYSFLTNQLNRNELYSIWKYLWDSNEEYV